MGAERSEGSGETRAFPDEEGVAFITNPPARAPPRSAPPALGSPQRPAGPGSSRRPRLRPAGKRGARLPGGFGAGRQAAPWLPSPGARRKRRAGDAAAAD